MKKINVKHWLIAGSVLIVIAILIGIIARHDIGFVFAGIGVVIIGIATLAHINKGNKEENIKNQNDKKESIKKENNKKKNNKKKKK